jgi:hemerythrin-like metal-binding protein
MPSIEWNPRYATGIAAIDYQHKTLVEHIGKLQQALEAERIQEEAAGLMEFLVRYVDEHFTLEEAYMEHIGYPGLAEHRDLHGRLRIRVQALADKVARGAPGTGMELSLLLFGWLRDHILHDDFMYVEHARGGAEETA